MIDEGLQLEIFRKMVICRRVEDRMQRMAMAGELPATLHPGAGQEGCQLAAMAALRSEDPVLYGHRGIGYWVARDLPIGRILCDVAGKEGGTTRGKGGLMHVVDPARGILGESGTLGGNFVVGAGVAMAERFLRRDRVTLVFFGEGTGNRGQFHEAANFAGVKKLPLVLFCENNGWAVSVSARKSTAVENIADRAAGYGMAGCVVDGTELDEVFDATAEAAARARGGEGPTLLEAKVPRLGGHFLGDHDKYRTAEEHEELRRRDPLPRVERRLRERGLLDDAGVARLEAETEEMIERAVEFVKQQPLADPRTAFEHVWAS